MKAMFILLFISGTLFADGFYSVGEFGYDWIHDTFTTDVAVGYEYSGIFAEAEQKVYMNKASLHMFAPFEEEYYIRAGYKYKKLFVKWEHLCIHGIEGFNSTANGHDRFTIGFDTRQPEGR